VPGAALNVAREATSAIGVRDLERVPDPRPGCANPTELCRNDAAANWALSGTSPHLANNLHLAPGMTFRRILAVVLIVFGLFALTVGGINYTSRRKVIDLGPVQATAEEKNRIPLPPVVGIVAVGAGVVLLLVGRKERA
jgi:hypothetical protein